MAQPRFSWRSHFHFALFCLSNWIRNFLIFLLKSRQMMLSPVKCLAEWLNGQLGTDGKLNAIVLAGFIQNPRRWMRGILPKSTCPDSWSVCAASCVCQRRRRWAWDFHGSFSRLLWASHRFDHCQSRRRPFDHADPVWAFAESDCQRHDTS